MKLKIGYRNGATEEVADDREVVKDHIEKHFRQFQDADVDYIQFELEKEVDTDG